MSTTETPTGAARNPSLAALTLAALTLAVFAASLLAVVATPWCTADRVRDPEAFVTAVRQAGGLVQPGDIVLVHPPWRDDVVDAIERAHVLPAGAVATTAFAPRHGEAALLPALVVVRDADAPDMPRVLARLRESEHAVRVGGVEVVRLGPSRAAPNRESDATPPSSDAGVEEPTAFDALDRAEVVVLAGAQRTRCL